MGKNVVICGADMSLSVHVKNNGKNVSFLGEGSTQELYDTAFTAEAKYPIILPNQIKDLY